MSLVIRACQHTTSHSSRSVCTSPWLKFETPIVLALPDCMTFSMAFQVSMKDVFPWIILPSLSRGKRSGPR